MIVLVTTATLVGCFVDGTPYEPQSECPAATLHVSLDSAADTLKLDSLTYHRECQE